MFGRAQSRKQIEPEHDPRRLARRYVSDLLGMGISAERTGYDALETAYEIERSLSLL